MPNYNYVVDSSFKPFSFDEILKAVSLYNSAYTNVENQFQQIADNTATLEYLKKEAEENPDSDAGKIYQKYAADMNKAFSDFTRNGLSQANRRDLLDLKRRYTSEIGLLQEANKALQKERERRLALSEKDPSMLYAVNNLKTDNFLYNRTPNMYQISGEDLRKEGAQYAANLSARMYTNPKISDINKYYQAIISTQGYNPQLINNWRNDLESIPEFNQAVNDILTARGVKGNLTGVDYERARQSVINGIMEGAAYKENMDIKQNEGVLTAAQAASINLQKDRWEYEKRISGIKIDKAGNVSYNPKNDASFLKQEKLRELYPSNADSDSNEYMVDEKGNVVKRPKTPEEAAAYAVAKEAEKKRLEEAAKVKKVHSIKEAASLGYTPVLATVRPSIGSGSGYTVDKAKSTGKYKNVNGWRSGQQGKNVPGMFLGFTAAPLVDWGADFSYDIDDDAETKMLSDEEYDKLPEDIRVSMTAKLVDLGYDGTPFEVMQVKQDGRTNYLVFMHNDYKK